MLMQLPKAMARNDGIKLFQADLLANRVIKIEKLSKLCTFAS